jgi:hypothetical protein
LKLGRVTWCGLAYDTGDDWILKQDRGAEERGALEFLSGRLGSVNVKWSPPTSRDKKGDLERIADNYRWGQRHLIRRSEEAAFKTTVSGHEARLYCWTRSYPVLAALIWRCRDDDRDYVVEMLPREELTQDEVVAELAKFSKTVSCHVHDRWGFGFDINLPEYRLNKIRMLDERGMVNFQARRGGLTLSWWEMDSADPAWREGHFTGEVSKAFTGTANIESSSDTFSGHAATRYTFSFDIKKNPFSKKEGAGICYLWECPQTNRRYAITLVAERDALSGVLSSVSGQTICHLPLPQ